MQIVGALAVMALCWFPVRRFSRWGTTREGLERAMPGDALIANPTDTSTGAFTVMALVVGLTYMGAAVIPRWPYIVLPLMAPALITSIVCTLIALFALGVAKGRIVRQAWQRARASK